MCAASCEACPDSCPMRYYERLRAQAPFDYGEQALPQGVPTGGVEARVADRGGTSQFLMSGSHIGANLLDSAAAQAQQKDRSFCPAARRRRAEEGSRRRRIKVVRGDAPASA